MVQVAAHCLREIAGCDMRPAELELLEAWRAVACAKLFEYRRQCWRLSELVRRGVIGKADAVDQLWTIATAHALVRALGEDHVQLIIGEAFAGTEFDPVYSEMAA
jgi:hypothetical protein